MAILNEMVVVLKKAVANAARSIKEMQKGDRDYTYSEFTRLTYVLHKSL